MKKILTALATFAIAAVVIVTQRISIMERLLPITIERTMNPDAMAALADDLQVVLCGAGRPLPDPRGEAKR